MMDDLISRRSAIEELRDVIVKDVRFGDELTDGYNDGIDMAITVISKLPSSHPERKKGEWKHLGGDEWCCNQCGNVIYTEGHWEHPLSDDRKMYHCNICGADMRGEENDS